MKVTIGKSIYGNGNFIIDVLPRIKIMKRNVWNSQLISEKYYLSFQISWLIFYFEILFEKFKTKI